MDSTANILQFCRLCLVKDGVNIPIFDEQGDIRQIYLKISSCLPVKVAREDHLPKKICDGCSNKLDICYDFWRTSAESEKQLLAWLGATGKDAAQVNVKEEDNFDEPLASDISKNDDDENKCYMFEQKVEEGPPVEINDEPPPSKRPRRTAAVKAAIAMDQNSDDDGDSGEPITKMEDDSDETDGDDREPAFVDVPSTSADDQPGPSGVSKDGSDAPLSNSAVVDLACNVCGDKFRNEHSLQLHVFLSHVANVFKCNLCDRAFLFYKTLILHQESVHGNNGVLTCQPCNRTFTFIQHLDTHHIVYHDGFRYVCRHCNKELKSRDHFKIHQTYHQELRPMFPCNECPSVMVSRQSLRSHKRKVHLNLDKKVCDECGKAFTNIKVHKRRHTGEKPYKCDVCSTSFAHLSNLKDHKQTHLKEKAYFCEFCGKSFNVLNCLKQHMRTHTKNEKGSEQKSDTVATKRKAVKVDKTKKECEICHKLISPQFLNRHIQIVHQGMRPYSCHICLKTFTQAGTLIVHTRYHTGERPYVCTVCSKGYVTRAKLRLHKCIPPKVVTTKKKAVS